MADVTLMTAPVAARESDALARFGVQPGEYLLVTAHRAGNVDDPAELERLVEVLESLPLPALFPVHPRTGRPAGGGRPAARGSSGGTACSCSRPLGYLDFLELLRHAAAVLTDSGGVQKEAYLLEIPCITLRETTEWTETVELGWNRLVGLDRERVLAALADLRAARLASRPVRRRPGRPGRRGRDWPVGRSLNCAPVEHAAESHCVGVVGLGYVGLPLALAFTQAGSRVVGPRLRLAPGRGDPGRARATSRTCPATSSSGRSRQAC